MKANFTPLSDQSTLILYFDYVSTSDLNSLNFSKHFPLNFNAYNQILSDK